MRLRSSDPTEICGKPLKTPFFGTQFIVFTHNIPLNAGREALLIGQTNGDLKWQNR